MHVQCPGYHFDQDWDLVDQTDARIRLNIAHLPSSVSPLAKYSSIMANTDHLTQFVGNDPNCPVKLVLLLFFLNVWSCLTLFSLTGSSEIFFHFITKTRISQLHAKSMGNNFLAIFSFLRVIAHSVFHV